MAKMDHATRERPDFHRIVNISLDLSAFDAEGVPSSVPSARELKKKVDHLPPINAARRSLGAFPRPLFVGIFAISIIWLEH